MKFNNTIIALMIITTVILAFVGYSIFVSGQHTIHMTADQYNCTVDGITYNVTAGTCHGFVSTTPDPDYSNAMFIRVTISPTPTVEATQTHNITPKKQMSEVPPDDCQVYIPGMVYFHPPQLIIGFATCGSNQSVGYYNVVSDDGRESIWVNTTKGGGRVSANSSFWIYGTGA